MGCAICHYCYQQAKVKIYNHSSTDLYFEHATVIYESELIPAGHRRDVLAEKTRLSSDFGRIYAHKSCSNYSLLTIVHSHPEGWKDLTMGLDVAISLDRRDPPELSVVIRDNRGWEYLPGG